MPNARTEMAASRLRPRKCGRIGFLPKVNLLLLVRRSFAEGDGRGKGEVAENTLAHMTYDERRA
jgi:hypothetical protein